MFFLCAFFFLSAFNLNKAGANSDLSLKLSMVAGAFIEAAVLAILLFVLGSGLGRLRRRSS